MPRRASATLVGLLAACGGETGPRAVDTAAIAPSAIAGAVVDECHAPLRGRMDRIAVECALPDGGSVRVFAQLPDRVRTTGVGGSLLLVGDESWRIDEGRSERTDAATHAWLGRLRTLVDAAALGPLHRAAGTGVAGGTTVAERRGPDTFVLTPPDGGSFELQLEAGTLRPRALRSAHHAVEFTAWLRTSATWMVQKARLDGLGECSLRFDLADLVWDPEFFTPPADRTTAPAGGARIALPGSGGMETRSPVPVPARAEAMQLVVVADPGDWPARAAAYAPIHAELERQNQRIAGFPMLYRCDERDVLAVPFRTRPDGAAFVVPTGWEIRDVPAGELLVVHPPRGDFAARRADGTALLLTALANSGRAARGPIVTQPYFHLQDGAPTAARLADPVVRMSVSLEPRK